MHDGLSKSKVTKKIHVLFCVPCIKIESGSAPCSANKIRGRSAEIL